MWGQQAESTYCKVDNKSYHVKRMLEQDKVNKLKVIIQMLVLRFIYFLWDWQKGVSVQSSSTTPKCTTWWRSAVWRITTRAPWTTPRALHTLTAPHYSHSTGQATTSSSAPFPLTVTMGWSSLCVLLTGTCEFDFFSVSTCVELILLWCKRSLVPSTTGLGGFLDEKRNAEAHK